METKKITIPPKATKADVMRELTVLNIGQSIEINGREVTRLQKQLWSLEGIEGGIVRTSKRILALATALDLEVGKHNINGINFEVLTP